jgi:hypothetical protein
VDAMVPSLSARNLTESAVTEKSRGSAGRPCLSRQRPALYSRCNFKRGMPAC